MIICCLSLCCLSICLKGDCDKSYGSDFVFSDHAKELIVGEIFVRVYNEVPTFQLEVRDLAKTFLLNLKTSQLVSEMLLFVSTNRMERIINLREVMSNVISMLWEVSLLKQNKF